MIQEFLPQVSRQLRREYLKLRPEAAVQVYADVMQQHRLLRVAMVHTVVIDAMSLVLLEVQHRLWIVMRAELPHHLLRNLHVRK